MTFRVGQKVVCIDDSGELHKIWLCDIPSKGIVYTVDGFFDDPSVGLGLVLAEIKNAAVFGCAYRASRFRPVKETKTDISIFTAMLKPSKAEA